MFPWLVLAAWAAAGIVLALIGHFRAGVRMNVKNEVAPSATHIGVHAA